MLKRFTAMLTVALLPLMFFSAPAQAVGNSDPVIVSPTGTVAYGSRASVTINFSAAPADTYDVTIRTQDYSTYMSGPVSYDGVTDLVAVPVNAGVFAPGTYSVDVYSSDYMHNVFSTFTVAAPPPPALAFSNVSISPTTFYPRVHDAYLDTTTMRYTSNRYAHVVASVRSTGGSLIRTADLGTLKGYSWTWNGRKNSGALAAAGFYNITITAAVTGAPASTKSVVRRVRLATGYTTRAVTKRRSGYNTSSSSHSSGCYTFFYSYYQTVNLDCWSGSFAKVNYGFTIPSKAYRISWGVSGHQGCCTRGVISKTSARPRSTYYRVSVKVTDWRSYTVDSVRVTYSYKRRI